MGSNIRLNINLEQLLGLSQQLPALAENAADGGLLLPEMIKKHLPAIKMLGGLAGKFVTVETGLEATGAPDTGPLGKGRLNYLLNKSKYDDESVANAAAYIIDSDLPRVEEVRRLINFTLGMSNRGVTLNGRNPPSKAQFREAVDTLLMGDGLPDEINNKFGDMIYYTLESHALTGSKNE